MATEYTPRVKPFNLYEVGIRWCYYTIAHTESKLNPKGWFALIGFVLLLIPYGLFFKITGKKPRDLELL